MEKRGDPLVGGRIRELRLQKGLTQVELAVRAGCSRGHISAIETGARPVGRDLVVALAELLGSSTDYVLARLGAPNAADLDDPLIGALVMAAKQIPREALENFLKGIVGMIPPTVKPPS